MNSKGSKTHGPLVDKTNVLVIVPAFNEATSVGDVLSELVDYGFHVLLVSDGSTDLTADVGRSINVPVLSLPINLGVGGALRAGFRYACRHEYEAVVQVDADGQHPTAEIERLITQVNETGAHMVIGSRFLNATPSMTVSGVRRIAMFVLARSASSAANKRITDSTSGFRIIRQPLLRQFSIHFANNYLGDTYEALVAAGRAGYVIAETPATLGPRVVGESTASTSDAVRFTLKGLGVALLGLHKRLLDVRKSRNS
jgi:glycosyltransferase involved in cell wall biosynthesis